MIRRLLSRLDKALSVESRVAIRELRRQLQDLQLLQGRQAALAVSKIDTVSHLSDIGFRATSQWGEDGIIEWLVSNLPNLPQTFVEFGVEDYTEANTRFLLQNRNWRGAIADISEDDIETVRATHLMWQRDLTALPWRVTRENINDLFIQTGYIGDIGLLSIDIDGNDYWVWEAINAATPAIVICEYNAVFGDIHALTTPYDPDFNRTQKHHSNLYWGASIRALEHLAGRKGYTLLGSNLEGNNAFFIRNELLSIFETKISARHAMPSHFRGSRDATGRMVHKQGTARSHVISELPVVDISSGTQAPLSQYLNTLYSEAWRARLGAGT